VAFAEVPIQVVATLLPGRLEKLPGDRRKLGQSANAARMPSDTIHQGAKGGASFGP
jgi:hypothetical protein